MIQWTCTVEAVNDTYTGDVEDLSERIIARLENHQGSASFGHGRILATFTIQARLVLQATETALKTWNKALDDQLAWSVVSLTARRADQPDDLPGLPEVLGIAEVAERSGRIQATCNRTGPRPQTIPAAAGGVSLRARLDRLADRRIPTILDPQAGSAPGPLLETERQSPS